MSEIIVKISVTKNGKDGAPGKSAYQYAVDAGYTGSEEDFAAKMAQGIPDGVLLHTPQTLTDEQQAQARENIGAASTEDVDQLSEGINNCVKTVNGAKPDKNGNVVVAAGGNVSLTASQKAKCQRFAALFKDATGRAESFIFFTDPHLSYAENFHPLFENYLNQIKAVYDNTPTSMCVCGGDWLNNGNTRENACWMLGVIDGAMKARFDKYINFVGNHDTNYQGYEYIQSGLDGTYDQEARAECILSTETIVNLWYRQQGNAYFAVDGDCTKFYVFDTGLDSSHAMDDYRREQIAWFARSLIADKPERCAALMHIVDTKGAATPMIDAVTRVANAYNNKESVTLHGTTYDFGGSNGTFGFVLGGHKHEDMSYMHNDIPVIMTIDLRVVDSQPSFDLVLVDWGAMKMHLTRVGNGNSRTIDLIDGSITEEGDGGDDGDTEEGGGNDVSVNLFTLGERTDYEQYLGQSLDSTKFQSFSVISGGLEAQDVGGKSMSVMNVQKHACREGEKYRIRFVETSIDYPEKTPFNRCYLRLYDTKGTQISNALASPWQWLDAYNAHFCDQATAVGVSTFDGTFTVPNGVASFQIGFVFDLVEDNEGRVRIDNINLNKASN